MVNVLHWNPRKVLFKSWPFKYFPFGGKVNNFGDLLGPLIVSKILSLRDVTSTVKMNGENKKLLTVGSILHFASNGDTVWGTGRNGKILDARHRFEYLDVRSVRGPLTQKFLTSKRIECPNNFGDPALLLPIIFEDLVVLSNDKKYDITVVPNLNDLASYKQDENTISPTSDLCSVLSRIIQSRFVIGSSLHAIVVAEAFGIPARLLKSSYENEFKYEDYYLGSGRNGYMASKSVSSALDMGGENKINFDSQNLLNTFPFDLWESRLGFSTE